MAESIFTIVEFIHVGEEMKRILCIILLVSAAEAADIGNSSFIPENGSKLLAESLCTVCGSEAAEKRERAFAIIKKITPPGKKIISKQQCPFIKTSDCSENEFIPGCEINRIVHKVEYGKKIYRPVTVFKFYTREKSLVGIEKRDLTDEKVFDYFKKTRQYSHFHAEIEIIVHKYSGFGTFFFDSVSNKLIVHCKIISLKN